MSDKAFDKKCRTVEKKHKCKKPKISRKKCQKTKKPAILSDKIVFDRTKCAEICSKIKDSHIRQICLAECESYLKPAQNDPRYPAQNRNSCKFLASYCKKIPLLEIRYECEDAEKKVCKEAYRVEKKSDSEIPTPKKVTNPTSMTVMKSAYLVSKKLCEKFCAATGSGARCVALCEGRDIAVIPRPPDARMSCEFLRSYCQKITILAIQQECYDAADKVCGTASGQTTQKGNENDSP